MAFPTVQTADTKNGTVTSNSTSWTITWPTNLASGDLVLLVAGADGLPAFSISGAGTWRITQGTNVAAAGCIAKHLSDGTETGTFTLTLSASEQGGWRIYRITGWEGTIGTTFVNDANSGAVCQIGTTGTSANPNSLSLDPNNWVTEDTLWLSVMACDTSRTVSVFPSNMPDLRTSDVSGGTGGATVAVAMASSAVSSFDPAAYTISTSDEWLAWTVGVRPSSAVAADEGFPYVGGGYYP